MKRFLCLFLIPWMLVAGCGGGMALPEHRLKGYISVSQQVKGANPKLWSTLMDAGLLGEQRAQVANHPGLPYLRRVALSEGFESDQEFIEIHSVVFREWLAVYMRANGGQAQDVMAMQVMLEMGSKESQGSDDFFSGITRALFSKRSLSRPGQALIQRHQEELVALYGLLPGAKP